MLDLNGRLVRTVAENSAASAGYHDLKIDGRDQSGNKLASGVYFLRIESEHEGIRRLALTILK